MKLYATVTSERASKGQGGKELDIQIKNEAGEAICSINVADGGVDNEWPNGCTVITAHHEINRTIVRRIPWDNLKKTKGEKQKGEVKKWVPGMPRLKRDR